MAGSDFPCNTKTQIIKDGLEPLHGERGGTMLYAVVASYLWPFYEAVESQPVA